MLRLLITFDLSLTSSTVTFTFKSKGSQDFKNTLIPLSSSIFGGKVKPVFVAVIFFRSIPTVVPFYVKFFFKPYVQDQSFKTFSNLQLIHL